MSGASLWRVHSVLLVVSVTMTGCMATHAPVNPSNSGSGQVVHITPVKPRPKYKIDPTRPPRPEASETGAVRSEISGRSAAVLLVGSNRRASEERVLHNGVWVPRTSQPDMEVPVLVRSQIETFLKNNRCTPVTRAQIRRAGEGAEKTLPQALLDEHAIATSLLTDDEVRRVGKLRIADYLVEAQMIAASYDHQYFDPVDYAIRLARFSIEIRIYDTTTAEVLWQGSHFLRATDMLGDKPLRLRNEDLEYGQQSVEAKLATFDAVVRACIRELLLEVP